MDVAGVTVDGLPRASSRMATDRLGSAEPRDWRGGGSTRKETGMGSVDDAIRRSEEAIRDWERKLECPPEDDEPEEDE